MQKSYALALVCVLSAAPATAEESADRVKRLASVIQESPLGAVTRMQAVLTSVCDQKGLAAALRPARDRAVLLLLDQGKLSAAHGDAPELIFEVTAALAKSYADGITFAIGPTAGEKVAVCHSMSKAASGLIEADQP